MPKITDDGVYETEADHVQQVKALRSMGSPWEQLQLSDDLLFRLSHKMKANDPGHLFANLEMDYEHGKHSFLVIKTNKFGVRQERQLDLFYEGTGGVVMTVSTTTMKLRKRFMVEEIECVTEDTNTEVTLTFSPPKMGISYYKSLNWPYQRPYHLKFTSSETAWDFVTTLRNAQALSKGRASLFLRNNY